MTTIYRFIGPMGKGYMRHRKIEKKIDADRRNAAGSVRQSCGHRHGLLQVSRCSMT